MSRRQLADEEGHRWDVEDEGPMREPRGPDDEATRQLRFTRDDGDERIRSAPRSLNQLADLELRGILEGDRADDGTRGPDTRANETGGYGDARD